MTGSFDDEGFVTAPSFETILYGEPDAGGVVRITLHRPERLNVFTNAMQRDLCAAFDAVDADPAARAVVVTGSGRAFCAGADLSSGERTFAGGQAFRSRPGRHRHPAHLRLHQAGDRGGERPRDRVGASMTLAMDARFASPDATFGFVFTAARHRPGSVLLVVPAAPRRDPDRARLVAVGAAGLGRRRAGVRPRAAACRRRRDRGDAVRPESRRRHRAGIGRAHPPARLAHDRPSATPAEAHRIDSALLLAAAAAPDAREGVAAFRERRAPEFTMQVPDDLPAAFPWWDPDERST